MKKICYILILFTFISSSQAQLFRGYGLKIGATSSYHNWDYNISWASEFSPDTRWGINAGVFSEFFDIPYLSLVTELNYVQKGMKDKIGVTTPQNPDPSEYISWDTRVDYLNLSALGKLRFDLNHFTPYIVIGPKIDLEINQEHSLGSANVVEDNFNTIMYGAKLGGGLEIELPSFSILAEVIYDYNFNDLYKNEYLTVTSSSFDFRLGIMF